MSDVVELTLTPDDADEEGIRRHAAAKLGVDADELAEVIVRRRSIDARGRRVLISFKVEVFRTGEPVGTPSFELKPLPVCTGEPEVVIVGAGPAGLYAAWSLARLGIRSIIIERGGDVRARRGPVAKLNREGILDPESNYCFGEGGAGTFSDGKLYTRATKRGPVRDVLELLVGCGAPAKILSDTRPHIGTNRLPVVVSALRAYLEEAGVIVRFGERVTDLRSVDGRLVGVELASGDVIDARAVVLATGHSARDVYIMCDRHAVAMESKPFALGVRIEHPQTEIDKIQYGRFACHPNLGAAPYALRLTRDGIGVYSFCMCPGGFVVPATTEEGRVVVNGMSPSRRDSLYANSGMVVTIDETVYGTGTMAGLEYQSEIEAQAFSLGGGEFRAPAQRLPDFLEGRRSADLPECSYRPGLTSVRLDRELPSRISEPLAHALRWFGKDRMRGYVSSEAVVIGVESRSSAPIRICRGGDSLESPSHLGLYPCGEGAGYAGGIVSAALDGVRVGEAIGRVFRRHDA